MNISKISIEDVRELLNDVIKCKREIYNIKCSLEDDTNPDDSATLIYEENVLDSIINMNELKSAMSNMQDALNENRLLVDVSRIVDQSDISIEIDTIFNDDYDDYDDYITTIAFISLCNPIDHHTNYIPLQEAKLKKIEHELEHLTDILKTHNIY